ncbi:hypothetical protein ACNPNP_11990 [Microbacterium sp. AGC85]
MSDDALTTFDALPDDAVPAAPTLPKPVSEPAGAREMQGLTDAPSKTDPNVQLLAMAFAFHPFHALFERLAVSRYPRIKDRRACVEKHIATAPVLYKFCYVADFVAICAVVLILLGTLAVGAAKTLFGVFVPLG